MRSLCSWNLVGCGLKSRGEVEKIIQLIYCGWHERFRMLSALGITSLGRERIRTFLLQGRSAPLQNHLGATLAQSLGNSLLFLASPLLACFSWHLLFVQMMVYPHRSWDAGPRLLAAQMLALNKEYLI